METKNVTLFVFDEYENFEKSKKSIATEGVTIKKMVWIDNLTSFEEKLDSLGDEDYVSLAVHVFGTSEDLKGIKKFITSRIEKRYPQLKPMYITDKMVDDNKINHLYLDLKIPPIARIYRYHEVLDNIEKNENVYTKKEIINNIIRTYTEEETSIAENPQIDYAIITALYKNEFEEVKKLYNIQPEEINTGTQIYYQGKIGNKDVVACFTSKTGMVDAAIIATEMINLFKPKYILMPGVCGGSEKTNFGDIIVANKVLLLHKGKLSNIKDKDGNLVKFMYENVEFDTNKVKSIPETKFDIVIEKFEKESDAIEIDEGLQQLIEPQIDSIKEKINNPYKMHSEKIDIHFEPIACSMMVINKEDYFDDYILSIDRKTKAVEMESYGVARASKLANGGKTKFLIFKSVMDKTTLKNDDYKEKAAYTSAQFLKHLLEMNII
jgi:nucleoside phosphorylase